MACGITVAPTMPTASTSWAESSRPGTRPAATPPGSIPTSASWKPTPATTNARNATIPTSKGRWPRRCSASTPNATTAVMRPDGSRPRPNSRFSPTAAPRNSATSVAIATTSACSHISTRAGRLITCRHTRGRLRPVTMPTLAATYCTGIAISPAATTTHASA